MSILGNTLRLNVQWAGARDTGREAEDGFIVLENRTTRSRNMPAHQQDEIVVTVKTENAAFAEKREGLLTRWVSSVFFPPTYEISAEQFEKMQMTDVDRGFTYPTSIEDLPLLVINREREITIEFSAIYFPANPSQASQTCYTKTVTIDPSSFNQTPYIQVTLEKQVFTRRDESINYNIYDHPPTLEERAAQVIANGATRAGQVATTAAVVSQVAASTALSTSQAAASTVVGMSQTAAQSVRGWLPSAGDVRNNCTVS